MNKSDRVSTIRNLLLQLTRRQETGIFIAFIIIVLIFSVLSPRFATFSNFMNLGRQISTIGIMAIGMTFLIIAGDFDLSVGSMFALVGSVVGLLMLNGVPVLLAMGIGILGGFLLGCLNGILVAYGRLPAFVVGLGNLNVYRGVTLLITGGSPVALIGRLPDTAATDFFIFLGRGRFFGVLPAMFVVFLVLVVIGQLVLLKTRVGFHIFSVGGNPEASRIAGINVEITKIIAFIFTGIAVGVASLLQLGFIGTFTGQIGQGYELQAISAVIIGGTKLTGGEGSMVGTLLGAAIMGSLTNGLVLLGVSPFWQIVVVGAIIMVAVGIDRWTEYFKK